MDIRYSSHTTTGSVFVKDSKDTSRRNRMKNHSRSSGLGWKIAIIALVLILWIASCVASIRVDDLSSVSDSDSCTTGAARNTTRMIGIDKSQASPPSTWQHSPTYNLSRSTESNYRSSDTNGGFYGRYAHVRSSLDYTYHSHYLPQRQLLQDSIIDILIHTQPQPASSSSSSSGTLPVEDDRYDSIHPFHPTGTPCHHHHDTPPPSPPPPPSPTPTTHTPAPWIVFTAGAMGAGKSYTIRHLSTTQPQRFPLQRFITVDPDEIRRFLPEFQSYLDDADRPELAGEYTRKESGMIAEILTEVALSEGKNVLVDGSLKDSDWYKRYFERLRGTYGVGLRIGILHVTAPRSAIFERARIRSNITGRIVPQHTLEETIAMVPQSIKILAPLVDFFAELHNAPNTTDVTLVTKGMTWESFRRVWIQPSTSTTTTTAAAAAAAATEYPLSLNSTTTAKVETVLETNAFCDRNDSAHIDADCDDQGEPWCTRLPWISRL